MKRESYKSLLKRTKGMGWFESGHEHSRQLNKKKPLSPKNKEKALNKAKKEYSEMINIAKSYD